MAESNGGGFAWRYHRKIGHSRANQVLVKGLAGRVVTPMVAIPVTAPATENQRTAPFHIGLQGRHIGIRQDVRVREKDDSVTGQVAELLNARQGPHVDGQMSLRQGLVRSEEHTSELQSRPHL